MIKGIGDPENDSERKAIAYLGKHLPDNYVLFHNEVKGYQGLIRGNAEEWKRKESAVRKSPIPLANKKAKILAARIQNSHVWVQSIIDYCFDGRSGAGEVR